MLSQSPKQHLGTEAKGNGIDAATVSEARLSTLIDAVQAVPRNMEVGLVPIAAANTQDECIAHCGNCKAVLRGPFCHVCGQYERSPVRAFFGLIFDGLNDFVRPDFKLWRTLLLLYFRPGSLTARYLEGQRVHFIKPTKLYFTLSVLLFLLLPLSAAFRGDDFRVQVDVSVADEAPVAGGANSPPQTATGITPRSTPSMSTPTPASGKPVSVENPMSVHIFSSKPWHPVNNPVHIGMASARVNAWLNKRAAHSIDVIWQIRAKPSILIDAFFSVAPYAMFVLLPIFALLLKLLYFSQKRLYAEHLLIAVQSHSFIFLNIIGMLVVSWVIQISSNDKILTIMLWLWTLMAVWVPIYLFWMQRKVYRERWIWTTLKFVSAGISYVMLLGMAASFTVLATLVTM